jgi:hypothetical protein
LPALQGSPPSLTLPCFWPRREGGFDLELGERDIDDPSLV